MKQCKIKCKKVTSLGHNDKTGKMDGHTVRARIKGSFIADHGGTIQ